MQLLFVRHGESVGNAQGRMQGHQDFGLTERGREQAQCLARWLASVGLEWNAAYTSPLARARETAALLAEHLPRPSAEPLAALAELRAGSLEGLTLEDIVERHPSYMSRGLEGLGDFSEFGGESYAQVQERVSELVQHLYASHADDERVLLVAHGGINFQILKRLICEPVPRVCILRMGNCTATLVRVRERRGLRMGEVMWHVPVELMGGQEGNDVSKLFR